MKKLLVKTGSKKITKEKESGLSSDVTKQDLKTICMDPISSSPLTVSTAATESEMSCDVSPVNNGFNCVAGDGIPPITLLQVEEKPSEAVEEVQQTDNLETEEVDYGYGEAQPDEKVDYGYGDAQPDDKSKYGYGQFSIDLKPAVARGDPVQKMRAPRRSSMKQAGAPRRRSSTQSLGDEIEILLPGRRSSITRRRSIQFSEKVKVKKVTPVKKLTDEPKALWFQGHEYEKMRRKSWDVIDKVEGGRTKGRNYCIRGLEKFTRANQHELSLRKHERWDAVLDEQERQWDSGQFDDEYMANLSMYWSRQCSLDAAQRGQADAEEIATYLATTRQFCRRLSM